jgi:hypothetical protein
MFKWGNLLHRNNTFITVDNKCSKIPLWTSVHYVARVWRLHVVHLEFVYLHISSCRQQHPKCKQAICLVSPPFICILCSSSNCTNKNLETSERKEGQTVHATFKQLCLNNRSESFACLYELIFTMTDSVSSQNIEHSSCITL